MPLDNSANPEPNKPEQSARFSGQHVVPKGTGEVINLEDESVSAEPERPAKITEKNVLPQGSGETFALEEESITPPVSQQSPRLGREHVIQQGSGEALELASPQDSGPGRPSVDEVKKFLKSIPTDSKDSLDEASLKKLISEGLSLIQRQEEAKRSPEDKLRTYQNRFDRLSNAHTALINTLKGLSELYDNPVPVLNLFAKDVQDRAGINQGNASILGNEADIARMTFLRASKIGLEESDIVSGRKKESDVAALSTPAAKKPLVRTQKEKDEEREAKKAKLRAGIEAQPEAAKPKEQEPEENDLIDKVDRTEDTRRLEESKPQVRHAVYEALKDDLKKLTRGVEAENPKLLELRLIGQTTARMMAEWVALEIKCCGEKAPESDPEVTSSRAKAVLDKLKPALEMEAKIDESLKKAIIILSNRSKDQSLDLGFLSRQEAMTFEALTSKGIRHSEPSVSENALAEARRNRQLAEEARIKTREGWKNDRFRRDGNEPPVGGI